MLIQHHPIFMTKIFGKWDSWSINVKYYDCHKSLIGIYSHKAFEFKVFNGREIPWIWRIRQILLWKILLKYHLKFPQFCFYLLNLWIVHAFDSCISSFHIHKYLHLSNRRLAYFRVSFIWKEMNSSSGNWIISLFTRHESSNNWQRRAIETELHMYRIISLIPIVYWRDR